MSKDTDTTVAKAPERPLMLELDSVSLSFNTSRDTFDHGVHRVLDEVSMKVYEGDTLGIIGRNGVGKTTMLRIMAGILAPTAGRISIAPGKTASLLSLGLGFKPELSGRDNALLAAMLQGSSRKQAQAFLEEIKEFSELGDSFEEPVKTYSAGMNARLGFTTALMTHVDILLVDEVLSVGDAHFRGKALAAMQDRITGDQTVVFVSHMADQVKTLCSRVIWLDEGKVKQEGDSVEVVDAYQAYVHRTRQEGIEQQRLKQEQVKKALEQAAG
ncbi:MAG: ABC transporter ATP-binding protein [Gammaproteobacteria bacterium]|jgi:lipopolysaccharide transport system ATP-binding protein|nr:ABC transporter ATP-binding protein [Gammaproteobacteria bacterium]